MSEILKRFIAFLLRLALWFRYRIIFRGLESLKSKRGILFLPNHPAEMDPVIVLSKLWSRYSPRSVVVEDFYHSPGLNMFMKMIKAIPMPNMWTGSGSYKRLRVGHSMNEICESLKRGDNVLIYPAGRMMHSGLEDLRAASGVFEIIQGNPETKIVLIRTTGLIGSSFSWVAHQQRPDLWRCLSQGMKHVVKNLIFFTPRREVVVEFEDLGSEFPRFEDKLALNKWLENWYNVKGEEPLNLVSYSRWKKVYFEAEKPKAQGTNHGVVIPDEIRAKVLSEMSTKSGIEVSQIQDTSSLFKDLGFDSLDLAEITAWVEEELYVPGINALDLHTVQDVLVAASGQASGEVKRFPSNLKKNWEKSCGVRKLRNPDCKATVQKNFLEVCDSLGSAVALADEMTGVLSFKDVKTRVLLLADIFSTLPGKNLGIMLPASAAACLSIFACLIAGKVPVMINWTVGDKTLQHIIQLAGLKHIISSGRFLDKIDQLNIELLDTYLLTLEDLRNREVSLKRKIKAFFQSKSGVQKLGGIFPSILDDAQETAVILFTSGSETLPKGVPLSHSNILSNIEGSLAAGEVKFTDSIYAFLPPFHSFGFTITTILPLMAGIKVAFYPNPLESKKIVRGLSGWKPTIICGTPTFISGILKATKKDQLQSLRLILVGAEKTPKELFERVKTMCQAEILEGYGITECSPVLTINRPGRGPFGVGHAVGDVEIEILSEDYTTAMPQGERGLIVVRGSNVFHGYLARESKDVFLDFQGKNWYITGDLGYLDKENHLWLAGRLKRFVKIGGEMVSLPAMEEVLQKSFPEDEEGLKTAISSIDRENERPLICLFTTTEITIEHANKMIKEAGFSNLYRVNHRIKVDEIPLLGTGKTDYRALKSILAKEL